MGTCPGEVTEFLLTILISVISDSSMFLSQCMVSSLLQNFRQLRRFHISSTTISSAVVSSASMSSVAEKFTLPPRFEASIYSVWVEFIQLSLDHKPLNLGQGFPDYESAPAHVAKGLADAATGWFPFKFYRNLCMYTQRLRPFFSTDSLEFTFTLVGCPWNSLDIRVGPQEHLCFI